MDREAFLDRVRQAARAGRAYEVHVREQYPPRTGYTDISGDWCQRLIDEINAVGGQAEGVADLECARTALAALLDRYQVRTALVWQHDLLSQLELPAMLAARGIDVLNYDRLVELPEAQRRQQMLAADIGITSADYAIAETGTLALLSRPGQERLASLLPPVHVALVRRQQVLADLFDLFERLPVDALPSNLVFVTGPSKTGDIELRLTTGVHGPREWHVICVLDG